MPFPRGAARGLGALAAVRQLAGPQQFGRVVTATDPAAGVEVTITVPGDQYWLVLSLDVVLVTSAVVGSREVDVVLDDGTTEFYRNAAVQAQSAAQTRRYIGAVGVSFPQSGTSNATINWLLPSIWLPPGFRVLTVTSGFDAGDNWGRPALYVLERTSGLLDYELARELAELEGRWPSTYAAERSVI